MQRKILAKNLRPLRTKTAGANCYLEDVEITVFVDTLKDYVGPEIYTRDRVYDNPPPGVANALSYSSSGNGDASTLSLF